MGISNTANSSFVCALKFSPDFIQDTKVGILKTHFWGFSPPLCLAKCPLSQALLCHSGPWKFLSQNCPSLTFFLNAAIRKSWQFIQVLSLGIYSKLKLRR